MNEVQAVLLTPEGWHRLHGELAALREQRAALGPRSIEDAEPGDPLVGIAELDRRIDELQRVLRRAIPVDRSELMPDTVAVGSRVTVRWGEGEEATFTLVGPPEVSPRAGRISYRSPFGQVLIGRRTGERFRVPTAGGPSRLEVVAVGRGPGGG